MTSQTTPQVPFTGFRLIRPNANEAQPKAVPLNGNGRHKNGHASSELSTPINAFPLEVFSEQIQGFIERCSADLGYLPDFTAGGILAVVSGAVGRSYTVSIKPGWSESGCLWLNLVGRPGSGKTHPLRSALEPIYRKDKELFAEYASDKDVFTNRQALSKADRESIPELTKPTLKNNIVGSVTLEALANILRDNPRGVLLHSDELRGWLSNFNRYTGGSDTEFWLSFWSGVDTLIDRATKEPIRLSNPFVSVAGTTQPGVLENMFKDNAANGLLDRMLFVWPDTIPVTNLTPNGVDTNIFTTYNRCIEKLLDERPEGTNELQFTAAASKQFFDFHNKLQHRIANEPDEDVQSLLSKLPIHVARLSLLLQMLRYACEEASNREVDETSVASAIRLAEYFESQARKVRKHLYERSPVDDLDQTKRAFYEALPDVVTTQNAVVFASKKYNIPERTVKRFLSDKKLFTKVAYGHYGKLL